MFGFLFVGGLGDWGWVGWVGTGVDSPPRKVYLRKPEGVGMFGCDDFVVLLNFQIWECAGHG
jgi:hypothetical protein